MTVTVPNTFATLPATPQPSAALFDQNFAALVAAINAITVSTGQAINAQIGTAYTVQSTDLGKLLTFTNGSAIGVTLPQAVGAFGASFFFDVACLSSSTGSVTITPQGASTINGISTLVLEPGDSRRIVSDGANYQVSFFPASQRLVRAWGTVGEAGGTYTMTASSPGASLVKNGTGDITVTTGITIPSANYSVQVTPSTGGASHTNIMVMIITKAATTFEMNAVSASGNTLADTAFDWAVFGAA